ncbi:MAG TPA: hypothetical protein VFH54_03975 [Mycobacteriales bacterium]|nr:hypothetical protein [Mycobacteriales bacterium]
MSGQPIEPSGSPLGRYDTDTEDALFEVRLVSLPVQVLAMSREQHDELMREFAMLALDESLSTEHVPARLLELVDVLGRRYGAVSARPDEEIDAAIARGDKSIDLVYHVPAHVTEAADALEQLMSEADSFCRDQQMLALARTPLQERFARWYLDQFRRQIAGRPPEPWAGPFDPD